MTKTEATKIADRCNANEDHDCTASVVRILPEYIDPPKEGDNGWDVEFTVK